VPLEVFALKVNCALSIGETRNLECLLDIALVTAAGVAVVVEADGALSLLLRSVQMCLFPVSGILLVHHHADDEGLFDLIHSIIQVSNFCL
jgi:hypothetical protein